MTSVSLCITSYNRFHFLVQTVNSFLALNSYPLEKIVIIEDSTNLIMREQILSTWGDKIELIFNDIRLGQPASIDKAYQTITSKYIFHSEDDYLYEGNTNFIKDSIDILEERSDVHQIWCRHRDDLSNYLGDLNSILESNTLYTSTNIPYQLLFPRIGGDWCGFSWNPGLRRLSDYQTMFPNGLADCVMPGDVSSLAEARCDHHAREQGYRAAYLINACCRDKGRAQSTFK